MKSRWLSVLALPLALTTLTAVPANAQVATSNVTFPRGATSTSLSGTIVGRQVRDYVVRASAGQTMTVRLRGNTYFNIIEPNAGSVAIYNSSVNGNAYTGVLNRSGPYRIRVYQMGAAKGGARGTFTLNISVTGRGSVAQLPGNAGGGAGGARGSIAGIKGMNGIKAFDEMQSRGFANVDSFTTGNTIYGIYYYRPTRLCVQTTAANNVILDIRDIRTHPKCR